MTPTRVFDSIADAVGWTPLVKLGRAVPDAGHQAFAKVEYMNPMGSIKDRIARFMVTRALADGTLREGGTVVEASSGNTAMGLAMMASLKGVRCKMVVRKQTSPEKLDCLRALGVDLVLVDGTLPPDDPESYNRKATQVARETPDSYFPDQHNNRLNNEAHYRSTGPELWEQMDGRIDFFVAGLGTGGTISGVSRYLKERDPNVRVIGVDVAGSVFTEHFKRGTHGPPSPYVLEGLGDEEIIGCPEFELIDDMLQVTDREAFLATRDLARSEAMFAGGSSGAALWGVRQVLSRVDRPTRIATIFPDSGWRYLSTIYNDRWMRERGFL